MSTAGQTVETISAWWYILPPVIGTVFGVVTTAIGLRPLLKERRAHRESREDREDRWDRTADAVWGREGNPRKGVDQVIGLRPMIQDIHKQIPKIDSVVQGQKMLSAAFDEHADRDELSFRLLERALRILNPDAADILRGRPHEPGTPGTPHE